MLARREACAPAELATTTFGPLGKYEPANDNVPGAGCYHQGGVVGLKSGEVPAILNTDYVIPRSTYEKLTARFLNDRPASTDSGHPERHGSFMQTATGRQFWPMDPRADEVFIEDIAHSLSLQCRYAGHCLRFYSVAEHSVLIARHLAAKHAPEVALWGLLHDASEAYLVDVPRPVKPYLTGYKVAEAAVMEVVCQRFGLPPFDMPPEVHDADNRIIADELVNMVPMDWHARYAGKELGVRLRYWSPDKAREEFMATFEALTGRAGRVA